MTQAIEHSQSTLNLESTQEALNHLRNLREKRKKESPSSIYDMVKVIYSFLKDPIATKITPLETISAKDYLGGSRDSIEEMLIFIKNKVCSDHEFQAKSQSLGEVHQVNDSLIETNKEMKVLMRGELYEGQSEVGEILKQKEQEISMLEGEIMRLEQTNKSMQIKLLNNVKRLSLQVQEKDMELKEMRKIVQEKESEIEDMYLLNEKKHKKMRKLEEDIYDLRLELAQKNDELEAERDCADFLEKKVDKLMSFPLEPPYPINGLSVEPSNQSSQIFTEFDEEKK